MKLFSRILESWKDEKEFEKRLENSLSDAEVVLYIKEKNNRRLKKIIRSGKPIDSWTTNMIVSENGKILKYYVYSGHLTNYAKSCLAHVSYNKLEEWGLSCWMDMELSTYGLSQEVYKVLMSCGNDFLIDAYRDLRHNAGILNYFLLPYVPLNSWGWEDFNQLLSAEAYAEQISGADAKMAVEHMVWPEALQLSLVRIGNVALTDAWLGADNLRRQAMVRLEAKGLPFEAKPCLCAAAREEIKKQGWDKLLAEQL